MCDLTIRQMECIKLLLEEQGYCSAGFYAEKLHVSDKTLLQDLKQIQKYMDQFGIVLERKTGQGIYLEASARHNREFLNDLEWQQNRNRTVSITVRRKEILRRLLLHPGAGISIQKLSEEFYVSRASIVNDFKYVEEWIGRYGLQLKKGDGGRYIGGYENDIRQAIAALMIEYQAQEEPAEGRSRLDETTRGSLIRFFSAKEVDFIESIIGYLESLCGHTIGEPYYINLLTHILICLSRTREGKQIEKVEGSIDVGTYKSFEYAKSLAAIIKAEFNLEIGEAETYYIYKYLISSGVGTGSAEVHKTRTIAEDVTANRIAEDLTRCISGALHAELDKNKQLTEGLLLHIRPMLNRLKYDISIKSEILKDIRENYGELLGLCQAAMWCISQKYSLKEASLDEISYIATYYQAMLETGRMEKRVLVVCHSGYGTSQLLRAKLIQNFPSWNVVDVLSERQLERRSSLKDVDFIVSTVPLEIREVPYIMVSAVLSEKDIRNIRNTFFVGCREDYFELPTLEEQFWRGRICLKTAESPETDWEIEKTVYIKKSLFWGGRIQVVLGICPEVKTKIYRFGKNRDQWLLSTCAETFDSLLGQLAELYQLLCSARGRRLIEECCETEDMKKVFEPFAAQGAELIPESMILPELEAADKEKAIRRMISLFVEAGLVSDDEEFYKDVMDREDLAVTSAGSYIAIPHGKSKAVIRPGVAIGRLTQKIVWRSEASLPEEERFAQVIIMFAVSSEDQERGDGLYLQMLKHIFGRLGEPGMAQGLLAACDARAIQRLFD